MAVSTEDPVLKNTHQHRAKTKHAKSETSISAYDMGLKSIKYLQWNDDHEDFLVSFRENVFDESPASAD